MLKNAKLRTTAKQAGQTGLKLYGFPQCPKNILSSDRQAVTAVTVAQVTHEIFDDTFGFRYNKLSINNKNNLKF